MDKVTFGSTIDLDFFFFNVCFKNHCRYKIEVKAAIDIPAQCRKYTGTFVKKCKASASAVPILMLTVIIQRCFNAYKGASTKSRKPMNKA